LGEHGGLRAEDEHAEAPPLGQGEQFVHQVDPGNTFRQRITEQPRRPHNRLNVGRGQLARFDYALKLGIALEGDELRGVDGHVLRKLAPRDEVFTARQGRRHAQPVEVAAKHDWAGR
jgi:hypothetical protein